VIAKYLAMTARSRDSPNGLGETRNNGIVSGTPDSLGIATIAVSDTIYNPSMIAEKATEKAADELNAELLDSMLFLQLDSDTHGDNADQAREKVEKVLDENQRLRLHIEQLKAEHASAKSELEFAGLKEEDTNRRVSELQQQVKAVKEQADTLANEKKALELQLQAHSLSKDTESREFTATCHLEDIAQKFKVSEEEVPSCSVTLVEAQKALDLAQNRKVDLQGELTSVRAELEKERAKAKKTKASSDALVEELERQLAKSQHDLAATHTELAKRNDISTQPTAELSGDSSEEKPLLAAAYQQISVLNTQLAHLYAELTLARTEVQCMRADYVKENPQDVTGDSEAEVAKQSQQIADLVSDIRHLQLDLEYHQQKLDQMIEEKQQMMRDLKRFQVELETAKRNIEERDQLLKHQEVDLRQLREDMNPKSSRAGALGSDGDGATIAALRAEASSKDSALIVSHYELHKEKLLRDRLEQKNLKLMERMQKLMMVVETMRKENITLERNLVVREQSCDIKDQQLREVTHKARQLQKATKAGKAGQKTSKTVFDLGPPTQQALPLLDRSQRSMESRSGASTPRTSRERGPPSPYGTR
jgi:chromosome segregation ATPase